MRNLDKIRMIHKDHILAVLDIDYSPTGKEFVTGSFDKTVRIFSNSEGNSRECYHDKRMQKVYSVMYSMDDKYVLSGSDDTNIRVWKAVANEPIKLLNKREEDARNYRKKLIEKFQYMPEIKRIKNQKHLPKYIINKKKELNIRKEAKKRKFRNKELNSKPGTLEYNAERVEKIVNSGIVEK
jgi:WD repeat and SOF domain-containing protein 1